MKRQKVIRGRLFSHFRSRCLVLSVPARCPDGLLRHSTRHLLLRPHRQDLRCEKRRADPGGRPQRVRYRWFHIPTRGLKLKTKLAQSFHIDEYIALNYLIHIAQVNCSHSISSGKLWLCLVSLSPVTTPIVLSDYKVWKSVVSHVSLLHTEYFELNVSLCIWIATRVPCGR